MVRPPELSILALPIAVVGQQFHARDIGPLTASSRSMAKAASSPAGSSFSPGISGIRIRTFLPMRNSPRRLSRIRRLPAPVSRLWASSSMCLMYSPVEVAGREADAEFDDLNDLPEVFPGRGVVDARRQRGLAQAEILEGIHDHVGQLVAGVAVPLLPADHQIDERLVSHEIHGGFLARISRGRTVREVIGWGMFGTVAGGFMIHGVFGSYTLWAHTTASSTPYPSSRRRARPPP